MTNFRQESQDLQLVNDLINSSFVPKKNDKVFVKETNMMYDFDHLSTLLANGTTIIEQSGYSGRWIAISADVKQTVTVVTATTTLNETHNKILLQNGATAITITLPNALTCLGRKYEFSRYAGSTGGVTILPGGGQIQALNGTTGATTSLGLHSVTGGGLRHSLTAVNIGGVGVWVRL